MKKREENIELPFAIFLKKRTIFSVKWLLNEPKVSLLHNSVVFSLDENQTLRAGDPLLRLRISPTRDFLIRTKMELKSFRYEKRI